MKFNLQIHGCQMNYSDSDRIRAVLEESGHKEIDNINKADLVIFVTCSVKQQAEDKVIGHFRELTKPKKKKIQIGLTGCMVRTTSNQDSKKKDKWLKKLKGLDFAFRIEEVQKLPSLLENDEFETEKNKQDSISYFEIKPSYQDSFRVFIPIMNGCNKFCTYCIVPYTRGREKSRNMSSIVNEIEELVKNGYKEITLLGQNVNSYGRTNDIYDQEVQENELEPFARLLTEIDQIPGKFRVRFTSPHPQDMSNQVIETICSLDSICNHIHLPLQSGDDKILKKMNRSYDLKKFKSIVRKFRKFSPNIAVSTDIIVGFCGETEAQFQNTLKCFKSIKFDLAYISQYSERTETYAEKNLEDNISKEEKKNRFHALNNLLREISFKKNQAYLGQTIEILVELTDKKAQTALGKTSCYKTVQIPLGNLEPGDFVEVLITEAKEWILYGESVSENRRPRKIEKKEVGKKLKRSVARK